MQETELSTRDTQGKTAGRGSAEDPEEVPILRMHQGQPSISASLQISQECQRELLVGRQRQGRQHQGWYVEKECRHPL